MKRLFSYKTAFALILAILIGFASASAEPWKFAIMSDTQWTGVPDDGKNPNSVAVDIINQLNHEFIRHGVKLVVAVGDVTDNGSNVALDTSAAFRQALYHAGIGFFPLRGNHESSKVAAAEFRRIFTQTENGMNNATPADAFTVANPDATTQPFPTQSGKPFHIGSNFSSPATGLAGDLLGLSYAFDYKNVRFVLLDQFTPADSASANQNPAPNTIDKQQPWIDSVLGARPQGTHAFVFGHKGLITENHQDGLFGNNPAVDPAGQDAFITSLFLHNVRYYIGGHDHMHDLTRVTTTDGHTASVTELVCASDSSKFYTPYATSNDDTFDVPAFHLKRQTPIAQDLYQLGYYIVTVDGANATVKYYGVPSGAQAAAGTPPEFLLVPNAPNPTTPALTGHWVKRQTFGYGLNGKEFIVLQDSPYTSVQDTFSGTTAKILGGANSSDLMGCSDAIKGCTETGYAAKDLSGRAFAKAVNTGWTHGRCGVSSNILNLWGMEKELATKETDVFTLSMNYDTESVDHAFVKKGLFGLATKDREGRWINAVDNNFGGTKQFVYGKWDPKYTLGTYGVDPATHTAWAVINHNSQFAVTDLLGARHDREEER